MDLNENSSGGDFKQWKYYLLRTLEDLIRKSDKQGEEIHDIKMDMRELKTKLNIRSGVFGTVGSAVGILIYLIINFVLKK